MPADITLDDNNVTILNGNAQPCIVANNAGVSFPQGLTLPANLTFGSGSNISFLNGATITAGLIGMEVTEKNILMQGVFPTKDAMGITLDEKGVACSCNDNKLIVNDSGLQVNGNKISLVGQDREDDRGNPINCEIFLNAGLSSVGLDTRGIVIKVNNDQPIEITLDGNTMIADNKTLSVKGENLKMKFTEWIREPVTIQNNPEPPGKFGRIEGRGIQSVQVEMQTVQKETEKTFLNMYTELSLRIFAVEKQLGIAHPPGAMYPEAQIMSDGRLI